MLTRRGKYTTPLMSPLSGRMFTPPPCSPSPQMRLSTLAVLKSRVHGFLQHRANNKRWRDKQLQDDLRDLHKRILFIKALKEGKRLNLADISLPLADKLEELLKNVIAIPSGSDLFLYTFQIVYCTHLVRPAGAFFAPVCVLRSQSTAHSCGAD